MPPEQTNMSREGSLPKKVFTLFAFVVGILIVIALVSMALNSDDADNGSVAVLQGQEKVTVQTVDLKNASSEAEKIPQGLPSYIPVETGEAYESYVMNYEDRNLTQYSISFLTNTAPSVKFKEYLDVMTKNGYVFGKDGKNEAQGFLYGVKDNDDLTVAISKGGNGKTSVQISYLDRR